MIKFNVLFICTFAFMYIFLCSYDGCVQGRSVTHKKDGEKNQAAIDKEVLFEDEEYEDDDILDLTQEEQKSRLRKLVEKRIDANQDGYVDLAELQSWSLKAFDNFDTDDNKEEFSSIDANNDGLVSWDEHTSEIFGDDFSEDTADVKNLQQYNKDKRVFAAADIDSDDHLSIAEYINFKLPRRDPATRKVVLDDVLDRLDTDKDGHLSLEEYLRDDKDPEDESYSEANTERFNDELDEDSDGLLNEEEILRWIEPDNKEDADDEAEHLMTESDTNKDFKLSASEIVDNHDLWVESDATDYGKQLLNHDEF